MSVLAHVAFEHSRVLNHDLLRVEWIKRVHLVDLVPPRSPASGRPNLLALGPHPQRELTLSRMRRDAAGRRRSHFTGAGAPPARTYADASPPALPQSL